MFNKKVKEHNDLGDLKRVNSEILDLYKEIRRYIKSNKNRLLLDQIEKIDLDLDYKSVVMQNLNGEQIDNEIKLSSMIKVALLDAQELFFKGTEYGVQLALNRVNNISLDRKIAKSPFLVEGYEKFDKELWNVIKLRELAYGEITRLKQKQDDITRTALNEVDPMMRVRYFEDIRVLEKDILRLENEAHGYDTVQTALHSEEVLKNVLRDYITDKKEKIELIKFENAVNQYRSE